MAIEDYVFELQLFNGKKKFRKFKNLCMFPYFRIKAYLFQFKFDSPRN